MSVILTTTKKKKTYGGDDANYRTESVIHYKLNKIIRMLESLHQLGK